MTSFTANKTSARMLVDFAEKAWGPSEDGGPDLRYVLLFDMYIKGRSFALINKSAFWLALLFGLAVVVWPALAVIFKDRFEVISSAVVQTAVTAVGAFLFALYSHYKKRQMHVENLMRQVVYSDESVAELAARLLPEMERIDAGFSFSEAVKGGKGTAAPP